MADNYSPDEFEQFLDELEQGKYDEPPGGAGGEAETPNPGVTNTGEGEFNVDEFIFGENGDGTPPPVDDTTVPPVENKQGVDKLEQDAFELQRQLAIAQGRNEAYQQMFGGVPTQTQEEPKDPTPDYIFSDDETALTEEEAELVKTSSPIVMKLAKQVANELYRQRLRPLEEQLNHHRGQLQQNEAALREQRAREFHQAIHRELPDLARISATPEFNNYLKQAAPRSGGKWTVEQELAQAIQYGNLGAIKEIVGGFSPAVTKPSDVHIAPGRPQSGTPPTSDKRSKMLPYSKLAAAEQRMEAGLISSADYMRVLSRYQDAEIMGLVDYNS